MNRHYCNWCHHSWYATSCIVRCPVCHPPRWRPDMWPWVAAALGGLGYAVVVVFVALVCYHFTGRVSQQNPYGNKPGEHCPIHVVHHRATRICR